MIRITMTLWACAAISGAAMAQTTSPPATPPPQQPNASIQSPNGQIDSNVRPRSSEVIAQEALPNGLESPGLLTGRTDGRATRPVNSGTQPVSPSTAPQQPIADSGVVQTESVTETTTTTVAQVQPVEKRWLMVPPMILDLIMSDTVTLGDGSTLLVGPGPMFDVGPGLPYLPVDEISVLPKICASACTEIAVPLPEACVLEKGQCLRAVMLIGGHVELVNLTLTEPCLATITMPQMRIAGEIPMTLMIGLSTGNMLYEQPIIISSAAQ